MRTTLIHRWSKQYVAAILISLLGVTQIVNGQSERRLGVFGVELDPYGALHGDLAAVAATEDTGGRGAIHVFRRQGSAWNHDGRLIPNVRSVGFWPEGLAVSTDRVIAGAPNNNGRGSAIIFRYDGSSWSEEAKLVGSEGTWGDLFGVSVDIDQDVVVVGASQEGSTGTGVGKVYVFRYVGGEWNEEAILRASDGGPNVYFGETVSLSADFLFVGAPHHDQAQGAAYVYHFDGESWLEVDRLVPSDAGLYYSHDNQFGVSVSVRDSLALIGAWRDGEVASTHGASYIFRYDGQNWIEEAKLFGSSTTGDAHFGINGAIEGNYAVVGAPFEHTGLHRKTGAAHVFHWNDSVWSQVYRLWDPLLEIDWTFAQTVSMSQGRMLIGDRIYELAPGVGVEDVIDHADPLQVLPSYPNPFSSSMTVPYVIGAASHIRIIVYDLLGREIWRLVDDVQAPGTHQVEWNGSGLPQGIYLIRFESDSQSRTVRAVLQD